MGVEGGSLKLVYCQIRLRFCVIMLLAIIIMQPWAKIWNLKVPPKVLTFIWRIFQNALPSGDNIRKRNIIIQNYNYTCPLCGVDEESFEPYIGLEWCGYACLEPMLFLEDVWPETI